MKHTRKYIFFWIIVAAIFAFKIYPFFFYSGLGNFYLPLPFECKTSGIGADYVWVTDFNTDYICLRPDEIGGLAPVKRIGWNSDLVIVELVLDGGLTQWIAIGKYGEEIRYFNNEAVCVAFLEKQGVKLLSPEDALRRREHEMEVRLSEYNAMKINDSQRLLGSIDTSLGIYFLENGSYPIRLTGCVSNEKDSWGTPINYKFPGKRYPEDFDLWSNGSDKLSGTPDDIWKEPRKGAEARKARERWEVKGEGVSPVIY